MQNNAEQCRIIRDFFDATYILRNPSTSRCPRLYLLHLLSVFNQFLDFSTLFGWSSWLHGHFFPNPGHFAAAIEEQCCFQHLPRQPIAPACGHETTFGEYAFANSAAPVYSKVSLRNERDSRICCFVFRPPPVRVVEFVCV